MSGTPRLWAASGPPGSPGSSTQPGALDQRGRPEDRREERERDVVVDPLRAVELEVRQGLRLDREHAARADGVPVDGDRLDDLADADRGDREVVPPEAEARVPDRLGDEDGERHAGHHPQPGRDAPLERQDRGRVRADRRRRRSPARSGRSSPPGGSTPAPGARRGRSDQHVARVRLLEDPGEREQRRAQRGPERDPRPPAGDGVAHHGASVLPEGPAAARGPPGGRSRTRRRT